MTNPTNQIRESMKLPKVKFMNDPQFRRGRDKAKWRENERTRRGVHLQLDFAKHAIPTVTSLRVPVFGGFDRRAVSGRS